MSQAKKHSPFLTSQEEVDFVNELNKAIRADFLLMQSQRDALKLEVERLRNILHRIRTIAAYMHGAPPHSGTITRVQELVEAGLDPTAPTQPEAAKEQP